MSPNIKYCILWQEYLFEIDLFVAFEGMYLQMYDTLIILYR